MPTQKKSGKRAGPKAKALKKRASSPKAKSKIKKVMSEYKEGELRSGSKKGAKVKSRKQAIAIALSEAGVSNKNSARKSAKKKR